MMEEHGATCPQTFARMLLDQSRCFYILNTLTYAQNSLQLERSS